ncbi:MAG: lysophospholipid acyltransferase family protein [Halioglobus sp.]
MPKYYLIPKRTARAWPRLEKVFLWSEALLFRMIFTVVRLLPLECASRLLGLLFRLLGPFSGKTARIRANLTIAFPEMGEPEQSKTVRDIYSHLGTSVAELLHMPKIWEQWAQRIDYEVDPEALSYLENGPAGVYVTAHVGAWQVAPIPLIRAHLKAPMAMVYAPEGNPYLHDLFYPLREAIGVKVIASKSGVRPLMKELGSGTSLALAVDTRLASGKLIPFFGVETLTNTTPARLALRNGGPLVPVLSQRVAPGRFKVHVQRPISPRIPDASIDDAAVDMTAQVNDCFEEWIRATPGQWLCLKRRWPKSNRL